MGEVPHTTPSATPPSPPGLSKRIEERFETILFGSRWLAVPIYVGFAVALVLLVIKFVEEIWHAVPQIFEMEERALIVVVLQLIDLSFTINLVVIVMFAGYENFVSRIAVDEHEDRPDWLDHIDFAALKLKLIASIVAIAAIDLLQRFVDIDHQNRDTLIMLGGLELLFVVAGLLLAATDRISGQSH